MAPITTASNEETHAALLDTLDMQKVAKPFRNPNWKPAQRRNKNLKQILSEAQRAQQSIINTQQNSGATTPQPHTDGTTTPTGLDPNPTQASQDLSRLVLEKNAAQQHQPSAASLGVVAGPSGTVQPSVTYTSIQAAPSLKPKKKYCDITGLPAKYTDPTTRLNYCNAEMYKVIKGLSTAQVQEYLAARNANTGGQPVFESMCDQPMHTTLRKSESTGRPGPDQIQEIETGTDVGSPSKRPKSPLESSESPSKRPKIILKLKGPRKPSRTPSPQRGRSLSEGLSSTVVKTPQKTALTRTPRKSTRGRVEYADSDEDEQAIAAYENEIARTPLAARSLTAVNIGHTVFRPKVMESRLRKRNVQEQPAAPSEQGEAGESVHEGEDTESEEGDADEDYTGQSA